MSANFDYELLENPSSRKGMKCIYKVLLTSKTKRAGLYYKEEAGPNYILEISGIEFYYYPDQDKILFNTYDVNKTGYTRWQNLHDDEDFIQLVRSTVAYFSGGSDLPKRASKVTTLTAEQIDAVAHFGVF